MRKFDETSGACIGPADIKHGSAYPNGFIGYEDAFAGYLNSAVELHIPKKAQPNLKDACDKKKGNRLPSAILAELQRQQRKIP